MREFKPYRVILSNIEVERIKTKTRFTRWSANNWELLEPGDTLKVCETFRFLPSGGVAFRADDPEWVKHSWRPGHAMPLDHCRTRLRVTREPFVQRMDEMQNVDAMAEGFHDMAEFCLHWEHVRHGPPFRLNPIVCVIPFEIIAPK